MSRKLARVNGCAHPDLAKYLLTVAHTRESDAAALETALGILPTSQPQNENTDKDTE